MIKWILNSLVEIVASTGYIVLSFIMYPIAIGYFLWGEKNNIFTNKKLPPKYMWPSMFN